MLSVMSLVFVAATYVKTACWSVMYFWAALLAYNLISAIFGLCIFRRLYVGLLRKTYRLLGSNLSKKEPTTDVTNGDICYNSILPRRKSARSLKREFNLSDAFDFVRDGLEVIVEDDVTKCFTTEELENWNFLNRTKVNTNIGVRHEILLALSILFRFTIFVMIKLPIGICSLLWLIIVMGILSLLGLVFQDSDWKRELERYGCIVCSRLLAAALAAVINIHHRENMAKCGSVCVANHTTPIDIVMLADNNCFTLVGQKHGGLLGLIQKACSLAQRHIWFERKVAADRRMVAERLKEHISNPKNNPILIFPEGTCINNTSVFMFKKGCFELGATIFPVVIKYHREFSDPYWNSQEQSMITYVAMLMTSWAIVCDVEYLKPTTLQEGETAIEFAQRVKADICYKGGLVDLPWDGMIKRPGNEGYLKKIIEDERKQYIELLQLKKFEAEDDSGLVMFNQAET